MVASGIRRLPANDEIPTLTDKHGFDLKDEMASSSLSGNRRIARFRIQLSKKVALAFPNTALSFL